MANDTRNGIEQALISWKENEPYSTSFEDVYYSRENGLAEAEYVFYKANRLDERLLVNTTSNNKAEPLKAFTIGETGFGTGLNFVMTWHNWLQLPADRRRPLHFISIEKHPLTYEDFTKASHTWPVLKPLYKELIDNYPPLVAGIHHITLIPGQLTLSLIFGDVNENFADYDFKIDAWFLDGFAPSKNDAMWSTKLFNLMAEYSVKDSTVATFTAASLVRKGLTASGFNVSKQKGYGKKREMITATFEGLKAESNVHIEKPLKTRANLWSLPDVCWLEHTASTAKSEFDVAIIGAGLSGLSTAHALAQRGLTAIIVDQEEAPLQGASGQDQLVMYAKFPSEQNKIFDFTKYCLAFSQRFYKHLQSKLSDLQFWHQSGVLQLAWNEKEKNKFDKFSTNTLFPKDFIRLIDPLEASDKAGLTLKKGGLWFEKAGWLDPFAFVKTIQRLNSKLTFRFNTQIDKLVQQQCDSWLLKHSNGSIVAKTVVIANANDARRLSQTQHLPVKPLRGQVSSVSLKDTPQIKTVLCGEGYLCPPVGNRLHLGATFDLKNDKPLVFDKDNDINLSNLKAWLPEFALDSNEIEVKGRAGLRCTTPDYIPITGPVSIFPEMIDRFEKLRVDSNKCNQFYGHYHKNLYVNIGHGSKGVYTTPVSAELLASMITGNNLPIDETMRLMLSPARFIIKHLIQRRI